MANGFETKWLGLDITKFSDALVSTRKSLSVFELQPRNDTVDKYTVFHNMAQVFYAKEVYEQTGMVPYLEQASNANKLDIFLGSENLFMSGSKTDDGTFWEVKPNNIDGKNKCAESISNYLASNPELKLGENLYKNGYGEYVFTNYIGGKNGKFRLIMKITPDGNGGVFYEFISENKDGTRTNKTNTGTYEIITSSAYYDDLYLYSPIFEIYSIKAVAMVLTLVELEALLAISGGSSIPVPSDNVIPFPAKEAIEEIVKEIFKKAS